MLKNGKLDPVRTYYIIAFGLGFLYVFADNITILFQINEASLSPIELFIVISVNQAVVIAAEIPTGVVADTFGRRASVVIGLALTGTGFIVAASFPLFETIVLGEIILGIGATFVSGAYQAWIADEVGLERANRVYLRTAQFSMWLYVAAVPPSVALSTLDIQLPIMLGGGGLVFLAIFLAFLMPENGYQPRPRSVGPAMSALLRDMTGTYMEGVRLVKLRPLLLTMLLITLFYGVAGLGFMRLWLVHLNENIGYPDKWGFDSVEWFAVIRVLAAVLGALTLEYIRRYRSHTMNNHASVSRSLFLINALQLNSLLLFAMAGNFEIAVFAYCVTFALSYSFDPYYLAWVNQNVESNVRATVLSMTSQTEALGRTFGGPLLGGLGSLVSVRAALSLAGLAMMIPLLLYWRAFGQGPITEESLDSETDPA